MDSEIAHPLVFVRHGETDWNRESRFQGSTDTSLNDMGREQARTNGQLLAGLVSSGELPAEPLFLFSSPLQRAQQTAQQMAAVLGATNRVDERLREVGFGRWEGLTSQEVKDNFYEERKSRKLDPWGFAAKGGESLLARSPEIKLLLSSAKPGTTFVTHSGIIRIVLNLLGGFDRPSAVKANIPHVGIWLWNGGTLTFRD